MGTTRDIEKGVTIKMEGNYFTVLDFAHIKIGRGGAFIRLHLKNLRTGQVIDRTVQTGTSIDLVNVEERSMQYIYKEGETYHFVDPQTYEPQEVHSTVLGEAKGYLKENEIVHFLIVEGEIVGVKLPTFVTLRVEETEPPVRGARVAGGLKPATLETGIVVQVPLFITTGDVIKVDTRTNKYVERVQ